MSTGMPTSSNQGPLPTQPPPGGQPVINAHSVPYQGPPINLTVAQPQQLFFQQLVLGVIFLVGATVVAVAVGIFAWVSHGPSAAPYQPVPLIEKTFTPEERSALLVVVTSTLEHRRAQGWHNLKVLTDYDQLLMQVFSKLTNQAWDPSRLPIIQGQPQGAAPLGSGPPAGGIPGPLPDRGPLGSAPPGKSTL